MRSFRKDGANLRDTRISYLFILSLTLICAIMGIMIGRQGALIHAKELEACYESLTLCADALDEWSAAVSDEARYAAAIRFGSAVASLPSEVSAQPLLALADNMRSGQSAKTRVRALSDTFALLASIEYTDDEEARRIIAETIDGVNRELVLEPPRMNARSAEPTAAILPEVVRYSRDVAKRAVGTLFGRNASTLELVLSDDGGAWITETDNLRMTFSAEDGSLDGFVYIRLGDQPSEQFTEEERLSAARDFFIDMRRTTASAQVSASGELCGFLLAEINDGGEIWYSAVDSYGRIWSLIKGTAK